MFTVCEQRWQRVQAPNPNTKNNPNPKPKAQEPREMPPSLPHAAGMQRLNPKPKLLTLNPDLQHLTLNPKPK